MNGRQWRSQSVVACVLAFCGCHSRTGAEQPYQQAVRALRDGNATQALELARKAAKRCPPVSECSWSARLLAAEALLSDDRLNEAATALAEEPPAGTFAAFAARRQWLMGDLEFSRGRPDIAEASLTSAKTMASAAGAWDVGLETDLSMGRLLFVYRHDAARADRLFRQVAEDAARRQEPYYEALAWNGIGMIRLKDWRFDEAIPWFQKAEEAAMHGRVQRLIVAADQNLAICFAQLGSFDEAIESRRRAMKLLGAEGLAPYRMNLQWELGNTYLEQADARKAVENYRLALPLAVTETDRAKIYRSLAAAYVDLHDWDAAEQSNNSALTLVNNADTRPWAEKNAAAIVAGRGRYEEACQLYRKAIDDAQDTPIVMWEAHAALAGLHTAAKNYSEANGEFESAIQAIDRNVDKVSTQTYRLTFFSQLMEFYQQYVESLVAQQDFSRALAVADSSRARTLLQRLAVRRQPRKNSTQDYLKIARVSNSVLLFYWVAQPHSYLWVVTPDRAYPPLELPPMKQIREWVDQYRTFIEQELGDPIATPTAAGRHLYDALIAPAAKLIPPHSRVILFPDDALNWLSFDSLPVYGDSSPDAKPHYWLEDVRPVVAPSLAVLNTEAVEKSRTPDSLLIIGDPVSPNPDFPKLGFASKEIETIEAQFPAATKAKLTGAAARPGAYGAAGPGKFSLMHFSAHAVANKESPLDSAIILSGQQNDYKLYARDIMGTPLRADLVTISACRSAGARSYSGEGLVGFTWAFLQAGAHNVIAGLWDVADRSTPIVMKGLYSQIASGMTPADALRDAKLSMIHAGNGYRRPYYWAAFQIYTRDPQQFRADPKSVARAR